MGWKIRRYRRWGRPNMVLNRMLMLVLFLCLLVGGYELGVKTVFASLQLPFCRAVLGAGADQGWKMVGWEKTDGISLVEEVLPVAFRMAAKNYVEDESEDFFLLSMKNITNVDLNNPLSFFKTQVAFFEATKAVTAEPEFFPEETDTQELPVFPENNIEEKTGKREGPLVAIYCTHNAECYVPSQGVEKLEGKNGGVYDVAQHLKEILEDKYKIPTILSSTIHDYPDWSKSYANSLKTLEELKRKYPSVKIFLDLHRDAKTPRESTLADINGEDVARIMFIVGSDHRLPHPQWKQNWEFAKTVAGVSKRLYPELIKGVRVQEGRYNQHVSPHCLLAEMGATENTLEEAKKAAEMLAGVIDVVVKDIEE